MEDEGVDEVVLETEFDNASALALYEALGFVREKRLHRFYSNGKDAFRLILTSPRHPLLRKGADREAQEKAKRENATEDENSRRQVPPEIAFVLAGPRSPATIDISRLSIDAEPPGRLSIPSYIM